MAYRIDISTIAKKNLKKLPKQEVKKIIEKIKFLAVDPRPSGCKKMKNRDAYRIREGNYRVIYRIEDDRLLISVINIGHRKEIYR